MSEETLPQPTPETYEDISALTESLHRKGTAKPGPGLYYRDGTPEVAIIEEQVSGVTLGEQENNVILATGMSAVREPVFFARAKKGEEGTRGGGQPVVAHARELYSQSTKFFHQEKASGIKTAPFDSGDEESVLRVIDKEKADVLFAETVSNTPGLPVLNVHKLIEYVRQLKDPPILILDNTLPLSTGLDFGKLLREDDEVLVIESGSKNLMNNGEGLGIVYSPNIPLMEEFRKHKAGSGALNSISALLPIIDNLSLTLPGFHDRNRQVFSSTGKIAVALAEAQAELGADSDFYTTHPVVDPNHPNHEYAKTLVIPRVGFISPSVFLQGTNFSAEAGPALLSRISNHPALKSFIKEKVFGLGQSIGMWNARGLHNLEDSNVRISGPYGLSENEQVALASAIKVATADK